MVTTRANMAAPVTCPIRHTHVHAQMTTMVTCVNILYNVVRIIVFMARAQLNLKLDIHVTVTLAGSMNSVVKVSLFKHRYQNSR